MKNFIDKKIIILIVSIVLVVSVLVNSTYSLLFKANETSTSNYTTGTLAITSSTTNNSVTLSNSLPMEDSAGLSSTAYTFQINNTGTVPFQFDVKLLSTSTTNQIDSQYIKVSVNGGAARTLSSLTDSKILENISLAAGASTSVTLRVWLASNTPNSQIGKVFNAKLVTDGQTLSYANNNINIVSDLSGHGHNGTISGATYVPTGLSFDGTNDYVSISNVNFGGSSAVTLDFVAKIDESDLAMIVESSINLNDNSNTFYITANELGTKNINCAMRSSAGYNIKYTSSIIDSNNFKHYTVIFNTKNSYNNFTSLYLNSVNQALTTFSEHQTNLANMTFANYPVYLGSRAGSTLFTKMIVKQFRIYNKALSASEITNNYNGNITQSGLIVSFDFNVQ